MGLVNNKSNKSDGTVHVDVVFFEVLFDSLDFNQSTSTSQINEALSASIRCVLPSVIIIAT